MYGRTKIIQPYGFIQYKNESNLEYSILHHQTKIHKSEERSKCHQLVFGLVIQNSSDLMGYLYLCMVSLYCML